MSGAAMKAQIDACMGFLDEGVGNNATRISDGTPFLLRVNGDYRSEELDVEGGLHINVGRSIDGYYDPAVITLNRGDIVTHDSVNWRADSISLSHYQDVVVQASVTLQAIEGSG